MDKIKNTIQGITGLDKSLMEETQKRLDNLTKPLGSLGRLEEIAKLITGITGKRNPELKNKVILLWPATTALPRRMSAPIQKRLPLRWSIIS